MTMHVMDKTWIYSFGGASGYQHTADDRTGFEVERLNTLDIGREDMHVFTHETSAKVMFSV